MKSLQWTSILKSINNAKYNGGKMGTSFSAIGYKFPMAINVFFPKDEFHCELKLLIPKVTTPLQFENWLVRQVTRNPFKNYLVEDTRYKFDFSEIGKNTAQYLFDLVLDKKENKSWLEPLQEIILTRAKSASLHTKKNWNQEQEYNFGIKDLEYKIQPMPALQEERYWGEMLGPEEDKPAPGDGILPQIQVDAPAYNAGLNYAQFAAEMNKIADELA